MRLEITHETRYFYSDFVRESVMELWLQPLVLPLQRLVGFEIVTEPRAKISTYRDWLGNIVYHFDLPEKHTDLTIRSRAMVETFSRSEPLPNRLEAGAWTHLRSPKIVGQFFDMLRPSHFVAVTDLLVAFMQERDLAAIPPDPLTGLRALNHEIYEAFGYVPGVTTAESPIDEALQQRQGVCQDFAHIMLAIARHWGIPSRYVSGYVARKASDTQFRSVPDASHAWVECYLPEHGWVGFDPTNDMLADEHHVVVAYGRDYADVPPTRGVLKGEASSELEVDVHVREREKLALDSDFLKVVRSPRTRSDQFLFKTKPVKNAILEIQLQMQQQQ
ncbi:MAG: transglutaminase family protein [Hyphomonadaceae bacterium]|nr:transglutaminase family protein [Hyphomonadaceae bacterium]